VTHYKTARVNLITSRVADVIRNSYIRPTFAALEVMKLIFAVLYVS